MKRLAGVMFILGTGLASAQAPMGQGANPNTLTSLTGQFFGGDFFNAYGYFNGVYDSRPTTLQSGSNGGMGFSVGGGASASKSFSDALLSFSYRGEYRNFPSGFQGSGTNQSLSLVFTKRLSRRWSFSHTDSAGMVLYGNGFFGSTSSGGGIPTNPFSPSTRFLSSSAYFTYTQSRRLSYTFGGNLFLSRYNYPGATGTTGASFSGSLIYQLTARTKIGGTYSHDNYYYQNNAGTSNIDGGFFNLQHLFGRAWQTTLSVGVSHVHTQGTITLPIQIIIPGLGPTVIGYQTGTYNTTKDVPTIQAGVNYHFGNYVVGANGGRGVNPGNGTFLTSTHTSFGGFISRRLSERALISGNSYFSRMTSIANAVAQSYSQAYTTVTYSRTVTPHISVNFNYMYNRYGSLLGLGQATDNRFTAGISFSTKNVPFTLF